MATAQVRVSFVNPVKPGKKNGSIKTADNQVYGVPPHMLGQFQEGATYSIEYEQHQWQGNWYKTVQKVTPIAGPSDNVVRGKFGQTDDKTAERIFVCGLLNSAVENGQIRIDDQAMLQNAVMICRTVWANTFGDLSSTRQQLQQQTISQELNDEVPF